MIQIDDAGSGSLVGGTVIGMIRVETLDFFHEIIPLEYFSTPKFEEKEYEEYCIHIILNGIRDLNIAKDESIEICQGYIFDKARIYLVNNGYKVISTKIADPLQTIIEETFMDYVIGLGIPLDYLEYTKYPFHFHKLLKWVFADPASRKYLCKTGWRSWKKYCEIKTVKYSDYLYSGNYICLKCGNYIQAPSKIAVMKYYTNREYYIYLHSGCSS